MTIAFLSLGSNIQPEKNIFDAVRLLSRQVRILKISTVYLTEPLHARPGPKFYNCVVEIETDIEPDKLKSDVLRVIEERRGRKRTEDKYASRTIDIDLILYGNLQISTRDLVIPDPEISRRPFLAVPLCEIAPDLVLPGVNKPIREIADGFRNHKMVALTRYTRYLKTFIAGLRKQNP